MLILFTILAKLLNHMHRNKIGPRKLIEQCNHASCLEYGCTEINQIRFAKQHREQDLSSHIHNTDNWVNKSITGNGLDNILDRLTH